jgi:Tfp pilus assembly pilus retraction ATPase PilT
MLQNLQVKDIYLGKDKAWLSGIPGTKDPVPAPSECSEELAEIRALCEKQVLETQKDEFPVRCRESSYRCSVLRSISEVVFVLRRMPKSIPAPEELSIHPAYVEMLTRPGLSGLFIVAGPFGQGKTTSVASILAARLIKFGGVGVTVEDPPEMPLHGAHGLGVCFQTDVVNGQFLEACRATARFAPTIIFIGEIRTPETAVEALRASINGSLVMCTLHADSVSMAIERLYSLANASIGSPDDTSSTLANGLLAVMHQRLEGEPRKPKLEFLWLGDSEAQGIRNTIRQRRFDHVGSEVQLQRNRLMVKPRSSNDAQEHRAAMRG